MAAYKVNISLPRELVDRIDAEARVEGMTRSGFVAEAASRYLEQREVLSADERRKSDIDRATARMRELGKNIPRDFDSVKTIREMREGRRIW
jgi:metal-responsive CopG/Arc/MetJ family transcriptional regulator